MTLKAGVIGVGYLGRFHAQKYALLAETELVGVMDINPQRAEEIAKEPLPITGNYSGKWTWSPSPSPPMTITPWPGIVLKPAATC